MNLCFSIECDDCGQITDCRLGLSNRTHQPMGYTCSGCMSPIGITLSLSDIPGELRGLDIVNGTRKDLPGPFTNERPFIDLHLDFPVKSGQYTMGDTPFMMAVGRTSVPGIQIHVRNMTMLNEFGSVVPDLIKMTSLFIARNWSGFEKKVSQILQDDLEISDQIERNRYIYQILEHYTAAYCCDSHFGIVEKMAEDLAGLHKDHPEELKLLLSDLWGSGYLKAVQFDAIRLYGRVYDSELYFRPAMFIDHDNSYQRCDVPYRISVGDFEGIKDLYKDLSEVLNRQVVMVAGINNVMKRGDHNSFPDVDRSKTPSSLDRYADLPYGLKLKYIDDPFYVMGEESVNNKLRNSVAHYRIEYDSVTQEVKYYPKKEGLKKEHEVSIMLLDFVRSILLSFREVHNLNHLSKMLYVHLRFMGMHGDYELTS